MGARRWPFISDACRQASLATNPGGSSGNETGGFLGRRAAPIRSCSRWGLPCRSCYQDRGALLPHPFTLTLRSSCVGGRFAFCGTVPGVAPAGGYPAPCFQGARTFLSARQLRRHCRAAIRPADRANKGAAAPSVKMLFLFGYKGQAQSAVSAMARRSLREAPPLAALTAMPE